jgi:ankyrin repeat protein
MGYLSVGRIAPLPSNCHPANPFRITETLDETYQRVLNEIRMVDRCLAHRLLQCLTMAIRPLRVEELAEILLLDFDGAEGATPKLNDGCRSDHTQEAVLSICSSLIMEVDTGHSRVIQFSHFSVKEFLTSDRLASFQGDISQVHIGDEPAHTTLAQACLATLLRLDGSSSNLQVERNFLLARYASQHWVEHAQFGRVSSHVEDGMRRLFNSAERNFATWLRLYDIDDQWTQFGHSRATRGSPLYYASLCGFHDLAEHIIGVHPEQVNAMGGRNHSPLAAALHKGHFLVAELLLRHDAAINVTGHNGQTPLQAASVDGRIDIARWLLDHDADTGSQRDDHGDPIHLATANGHLEVIQALLTPKHGVYIDSADRDGRTPLHLASASGKVEIARLLLEHGANANAVAKDGSTPLYLATTEIERLLLDHGASPLAGEEGKST